MASELQSLGYRMVIWPETLMYAAFSAMERVATELKREGTIGTDTRRRMTDFRRMCEFLELEALYDLEKKYAGSTGDQCD